MGEFEWDPQSSTRDLTRCWRGGLRQIIKGPSKALMSSRWFSAPPEICFSKAFDSKEEWETWIAPCRSHMCFSLGGTLIKVILKSEEGTSGRRPGLLSSFKDLIKFYITNRDTRNDLFPCGTSLKIIHYICGVVCDISKATLNGSSGGCFHGSTCLSFFVTTCSCSDHRKWDSSKRYIFIAASITATRWWQCCCGLNEIPPAVCASIWESWGEMQLSPSQRVFLKGFTSNGHMYRIFSIVDAVEELCNPTDCWVKPSD